MKRSLPNIVEVRRVVSTAFTLPKVSPVAIQVSRGLKPQAYETVKASATIFSVRNELDAPPRIVQSCIFIFRPSRLQLAGLLNQLMIPGRRTDFTVAIVKLAQHSRRIRINIQFRFDGYEIVRNFV